MPFPLGRVHPAPSPGPSPGPTMRTRETLLSLLLFGAIAGLFFLPCLAGRTFLPSDFLVAVGLVPGASGLQNFRRFDAIDQIAAQNHALARAAEAGEGPAWDPFRLGGLPLAADRLRRMARPPAKSLESPSPRD